MNRDGHNDNKKNSSDDDDDDVLSSGSSNNNNNHVVNEDNATHSHNTESNEQHQQGVSTTETSKQQHNNNNNKDNNDDDPKHNNAAQKASPSASQSSALSEDDKAYIAKHDLDNLLQAMMLAMLRSKPSSPAKFLIQKLQRAAGKQPHSDTLPGSSKARTGHSNTHSPNYSRTVNHDIGSHQPHHGSNQQALQAQAFSLDDESPPLSLKEEALSFQDPTEKQRAPANAMHKQKHSNTATPSRQGGAVMLDDSGFRDTLEARMNEDGDSPSPISTSTTSNAFNSSSHPNNGYASTTNNNSNNENTVVEYDADDVVDGDGRIFSNPLANNMFCLRCGQLIAANKEMAPSNSELASMWGQGRRGIMENVNAHGNGDELASTLRHDDARQELEHAMATGEDGEGHLPHHLLQNSEVDAITSALSSTRRHRAHNGNSTSNTTGAGDDDDDEMFADSVAGMNVSMPKTNPFLATRTRPDVSTWRLRSSSNHNRTQTDGVGDEDAQYEEDAMSIATGVDDDGELEAFFRG